VGSIILPYLWVQDSKLDPLKEFPWQIVVCFCRSQNQQQSTTYRAGSLGGGGGGAATFETSEMRKFILTLSMTKATLKAEAILKICQLFTYGDIHYIL
jgi:hypothetical protein